MAIRVCDALCLTAADGADASADKSKVMLHLPSKPVLDATKNLNELLTHLLVSHSELVFKMSHFGISLLLLLI